MENKEEYDSFKRCEHGSTRCHCQKCEDDVNADVIYPPCKKCGAKHGMGMKDTMTLKITPLDLCYECLWESWNKIEEGKKHEG